MSRWTRFRRRDRIERAIDAELRDHLERLAADLLARGLDERDARSLARLEFGGLDQIKDACRDQRPLAFVNGFSPPWTFAMLEQIRRRSQMFDGALAWSVAPFNLAEA